MQMFCRRNSAFFVIASIYFFIGVIVLWYYQYQVNPDGISYIRIAEKYKAGDFNGAVNASWGPLISWLLMPFIQPGISEIFSIKILQLLIGFFTVLGIYILPYPFQKRFRILFVFTSIPIILYQAMILITPDLLLGTILLYYIYSLNLLLRSNKAGYLIGMVGGLGYLTKHYFFCFFLIHFTIAIIYYIAKNPSAKKILLQNFFRGLIVFFLITFSWIAILSIHYKSFVMSPSSLINSYISPHVHRDMNLLFGGLRVPPLGSIVFLEDVSLFSPVSWSPFQSAGMLLYELKNFANNVRDAGVIYYQFSLLWLPITLLFVFIIVRKRDVGQLYLSIFLIYPAGYLLLFVEERYLWPMHFLLLFFVVYIAQFLCETTKRSQLNTGFFLGGLAVLLSFTCYPLSKIVAQRNSGKTLYLISERYKNTVHSAKIAADPDLFLQGLALAYYTDSTFYGMPRNDQSSNEIRNDFKKYGINYFLAKSGIQSSRFGFLHEYRDITDNTINEFRMYKIRSD